MDVRILTAGEARADKRALGKVLLDCVAGGASVNFLSITSEKAEAFFDGVIASVERCERLLLAAYDGSDLVGTVQVILATPENQPHRADVAKLLVQRDARGKGIAARLMQEAERAARKAGRTLLVLDTCVGGAAERLYQRLGWTKAGVIPDYAYFPDGSLCSTAIFWKRINKPFRRRSREPKPSTSSFSLLLPRR